MSAKEHISKLPNSPIQEVIFEMILNQEVDSNGNPTEESFDLAQGVFNKAVSDEFKHRIIRALPPNIKIFPRIKYQYWTNQNEWPVVQIGPGILTVNDTDKNYEWDRFYPLVLENINRLIDSYPEQVDINKIVLRYIDAIELGDANPEEKLNFINNNFKLKLINDFSLEDANLLGININQTYRLKDSSILNFSITDGKSKRNKPAVVWQTQVSNSNVKSLEDIAKWLETAHSITSNLFKDTITKQFYEQFK